MKKIRYIIVLTGIILIIIIVALLVNRKIRMNEEIKKQDVYDYFHTDNGKKELIQKVCEKNGNWKYYPLSSKFLNKYNEKDGYFADIEYDEVKVNEYKDSNYFFSIYDHIGITQGKKKTVYIYAPKYGDITGDDPGLDDILICYEIPITDENGIKLDERLSFKNSDYKKHNLYSLIDWDGSEKGVATTNHFQDKYPHFLDLFIHYSPLSFNKIRFIEKESDLNNNIAIFEVDSILECKKRKYRVKLILDDKLYLDDAEVELLEEKVYEGNSQNSSAKAFYTHSTLDKTNLTEEFIEEIKQKGSCFIDIDSVDIDYDIDEKCINNKDYTEYIRTYKMKNGNKYSYYEKYYISNNGEIEDISFEKLDYINMTSEEVVKQYLDK